MTNEREWQAVAAAEPYLDSRVFAAWLNANAGVREVRRCPRCGVVWRHPETATGSGGSSRWSHTGGSGLGEPEPRDDETPETDVCDRCCSEEAYLQSYARSEAEKQGLTEEQAVQWEALVVHPTRGARRWVLPPG